MAHSENIKRLLELNVEIEGLLHVLDQRGSSHARSILGDRFNEFQNLLKQELASGDETQISEIVEQEKVLASDAQHIEVKDQEAEENEVEDETDDAVAAIERGEKNQDEYNNKPERSLASVFTVNDKYRFVNSVFKGDERSFLDTVTILQELPSFEEAESFLYNEMMLDSEDKNVKEFVDFLSKHFQAKA